MSVKFADVYNQLPDGWLSEKEAMLLWNAVQETEGTIVEVGVYKGRSTCLMGATGRVLRCIDPFSEFDSGDPSGDSIYQAWCENIQSRKISAWLHRNKVEEVPPLVSELVYLDGDHTYQGTLNQIKYALACFPKYVLIHDVNDSGGGLEVKKAAIELLGPWTTRVERLALWKLR